MHARILGLAVTVAGVACVASVLAQPWRQHLHLVEELLTPQVTNLASGGVALTGIALILVGRGIAQRRRLAFYFTAVLLAVATVAHLVLDLDIASAFVTAALGAVLVYRRRLFVVAPGPAQVARVLRMAAALLAVDVAYGVIGLVARAGQIRPRLAPGVVAAEVAARLFGQPGPLTVTGRFGHWFPASLTVLGAVSLGAVVLAALAPTALPASGHADEREEVRRLLDQADGDTLDPFILRRGKRWAFSAERDAVLGFRRVHGVGLASGDPVGNPAAFPGAVRVFLRVCADHGLIPAVMGVREDRLPAYAELGLRALYIGDEAVIDTATFSLAGRRMRNVRQAVSRTRNAGVRTQILREAEIDPQLRRALLVVAATQRQAFREFGFSMALGDLLTGAYPECLIVVCQDRTSQPVAFQRYVPCQKGRALSLDTMRRLPGVPGGVNERMIAEVVGWASKHAVGRVSLNFAAFRTLLDEDAELEPGQAMEAWLIRRMEGRFGIQMDSLRRFNAKFQPCWIPRYLTYRSPAHLPAIGLAALSAEGFLPFDRSRAAETAVNP